MLVENVIILHGTGGSPDGNWFPWLKKELENLGIRCEVPKFSTPENQNLDNWFKTLNDSVSDISQSTTVIGHSCGAVFLLRLLEKLNFPIHSSFFVAGLLGIIGIEEFDVLNHSFIKDPYNWEKIRDNAGNIFCFSGDNDPYVPHDQSLELAKNLKTNPIIIKNGGHLNAESGYYEFNFLLEKIVSINN